MNNFKKSIINKFSIPNKITNDYLDDIILDNLSIDENIWGFCFRDLTNVDMKDIDLHKLLKCSFSGSTKFPDYIADKLNMKKIYKLAKTVGFGWEKLNIDSSKINIAVIDHAFLKQNKSFSNNVILSSYHPMENDSYSANAIITTIHRLLPNSKIFHWDTVSTFEGRYKALSTIYDYNNVQRPEKRIHCVSLSLGLTFYGDNKVSDEQNDKLYQLVDKLAKQGCYIIDLTEFRENNLYISSPHYTDNFEYIIAHEPGQNWDYNNGHYDKNINILVPGGGQIYGYPSKEERYYYCGTASYQLAIPIIACFFSACKTKNPNLTLNEFFKKVIETATVNDLGYKEINIYKLYNSL